MARPRKEGMDYFPHDTDASNDEKIEILRSLYGNDGYAFYFIMLERIYRTNEFEIDVSDAETKEEMFQILSRKVAVNKDLFEKILNTCFKYKLFDEEEYRNRGVITSIAVKKRAEPVLSKRQKMKEKYNNKIEGVVSAPISDAETPTETTQSIVKESKEKHSKEKESINAEINNQAIEICKYYSTLKPNQSITQHLSQLKIWIDMYGYDWTKEAIEKTVANKNKFIQPYIEKILKDWTVNGKEDIKGGGIKQNPKPEQRNIGPSEETLRLEEIARREGRDRLQDIKCDF